MTDTWGLPPEILHVVYLWPNPRSSSRSRKSESCENGHSMFISSASTFVL